MTNNNDEEEMNDSDVLVGLDVGTQSTKAILYQPSTQTVLARASQSYDLDNNNNGVDGKDDIATGRAEQHPSKWITAIKFTLAELSKTIHSKNYKVCGIGVSGQQHGMVPLDCDFNVIRSAKLWCDVESHDQARTFSERATEIMTGREKGKEEVEIKWDIPAGFTAPKVLWMKEKEKGNWDKVRWVVLPHDYVNLILKTGLGCDDDGGDDDRGNDIKKRKRKLDEKRNDVVPTTDAGDASGSGIFDPRTRDYVPELASVIDEKYALSLPRILPPNAISGYLAPQWKKLLYNNSEQCNYEIPISAGSGDNMSSALGCGCVSPGMAVLSLGTSGTIFGVSNTPVKTGTPVAPFCDATGKHLPLVCVMSCTGVLNSVLEHWCSSSSSDSASSSSNGGTSSYINKKTMTHDRAIELVIEEGIPPGCNGLTFLPYLGGERTPNWPNAFGALMGLTAQNMDCMSGGRPGLVYRAAMEGITYLIADALDMMRNACNDNRAEGSGDGGGFSPTSLLVVGGGSKNRMWRQMFADVLGLELRFPLEAESASLGAAFQAGAASTGVTVEEYVSNQRIEMEDIVVKPTECEETLKLYQEGLARYRKWSRKLFD